MTHLQAITLKGMTIPELYKVYRLQGITAKGALATAKCVREIATQVLTQGSFLNHFNKYHGIPS